MLKPNMTRLIIYLVVFIGLIIFIFTIPEEKNDGDSSPKKDMISEAEMIELPSNDSLLKDGYPFEIRIDSLGTYHTSVTDVSWNELCNEIRVQKKVHPKLYLKISVDIKSKSEVLIKLMEFALKEKIPIAIGIGITKN